ncbi:MAG: NACHT domain-containing protein [Lachnospiraceae bacterium]|nr:NACHT domain-containing protein [Lachnospiraceae bacterium]
MINRMYMARERERRNSGMAKYRVCGGTFLYILLQAISAKAKRRGLNNEGIKESTCFTEFIKLGQKNLEIVGDKKTIAQETSKYKYCKIEASSWMPFTNESYIESLNLAIEREYDDLLQSIIIWAEKYLDLVQYGDWLAKAFVELFFFDDTIDKENTYLYVNNDGTKSSLNDLFDSIEIRIQSLILGVWHYIVNHNIANSEGLDTINILSKNDVELGAVRARRGGIGKSGLFSYRVMITSSFRKKEASDIGFPPILEPEVEETVNLLNLKDQANEEIPVASMLSGESVALPNDEFSNYLSNLRSAYHEVKTLLFRQEPRDFDSIYLANDISAPKSYQYSIFGGVYETGTDKTILKNATVESITARTNFIILSGIGGLGKSMMMRHLLLDAIDHYEKYKLLPIFVPLKDYTAEYKSLFDFIYEIYDSYGGNRSFTYSRRNIKSLYELREIMESGRCLFLLDGLDEIKAAIRPKFERQLENLTNGYRENIFILSSRPYTNYVKFGRFVKMDLLPFTKAQSVALLKKLDMGQEEPLKERFTKELEESLYETHKEFAENPLLLTIMLLTYKTHANIPVKMHKFYSRAYDTLFTEHDANKIGYRREYKTDLNQDRFAEYFDEFCFLSYQDGNFDPSPEECKKYFEELEAVIEDSPSFTWKDFMDDLTDSVCLMYEEGQKYHFLHRSFQEYFCARYFYRQEETSLWDIAMFFDDMDIKETDKTFAMLYDMKPKPIENNVFLKFLKNLYTPEGGTDEDSEDAYKLCYEKFLLTIYPYIIWDEGEVIEPSVNKPVSYIYSFIANVNELKEDTDDFMIPCYSKDIETVDEFVYFDPDFEEDVDDDGYIEYSQGGCEELYSIDEVTDEYLEHFDAPEVVGTTYQLKIENVFKHADENSEIIALLYDEDFPLRIEFEAMHDYYLKLKNQASVRKKDLRSKLRKKKR